MQLFKHWLSLFSLFHQHRERTGRNRIDCLKQDVCMKEEKKKPTHSSILTHQVIILSTMGESKLHQYKNLSGCRSYNCHKWHFLFPLKNLPDLLHLLRNCHSFSFWDTSSVLSNIHSIKWARWWRGERSQIRALTLQMSSVQAALLLENNLISSCLPTSYSQEMRGGSGWVKQCLLHLIKMEISAPRK